MHTSHAHRQAAAGTGSCAAIQNQLAPPCRHTTAHKGRCQRAMACAKKSSSSQQTTGRRPSDTAPAGTLPAVRSSSTRSPGKVAAFAVVLTMAGVLCYNQLSARDLPEVSPQLQQALLAALAAPAVGITLLKLLLQDNFHVELHRARLYFTIGVPPSGPPLQPGAVEVRPTTDGRGHGAFAVLPIAKGTHVIDYEGEALDRQAFFAKYPSGEGDFAMAIDDEWVLDAAHLVDKTDTFSGVHMNHSKRGANVGRFYKRAHGRVAFFALRDIAAGEELLFDYGRDYWRGREHLLIGEP